MTSDGISTEDWDQVHELAVQIVNAADSDEEPACRERLFAYLDDLSVRYGERASVVATRADYVRDPKESERLFLRAFDLAIATNDAVNIRLISLSLAQLYADKFSDPSAATRWLDIARAHVGAGDKVDEFEFRQVDAAIDRARKDRSDDAC